MNQVRRPLAATSWRVRSSCCLAAMPCPSSPRQSLKVVSLPERIRPRDMAPPQRMLTGRGNAPRNNPLRRSFATSTTCTDGEVSGTNRTSLTSPPSTESTAKTPLVRVLNRTPPTESTAATPLVRVITVEVLSDHREEFDQWRAEFKELVAKLNLHMKVDRYSSSPTHNAAGAERLFETAVMTFPSRKELERWESSEERIEWLERGIGKRRFAVVSRASVNLDDDFLYDWISSARSRESSDPPPAKWRMALLVSSATYPATLFVQKWLLPVVVVPVAPWVATQPAAIQVALSLAVTVPLMTYAGVPAMFHVLGPYVLKSDPANNARNAAVVGIAYVSMVGGALIAMGDADYVQRAMAMLF